MKSHTFDCGCVVTFHDDSADWEPCYIHDVAEDWHDAIHALPAYSLVIVTALLEKALRDLPKSNAAFAAVDVLRVDILKIGQEKLRADDIETSFTDLVRQWYKSELLSQAAWYQAQLGTGQ